MNKTIQELAIEAIEEACILEFARDKFDETHMLETAEGLSGVPYFMIKQVYERKGAWKLTL